MPNLPRQAVDDTETIHAVPMPITIRPRGYGPELFAAVKAQAGVSELMTAQARMCEAKTLF